MRLTGCFASAGLHWALTLLFAMDYCGIFGAFSNSNG
jgi:hypothetical protein